LALDGGDQLEPLDWLVNTTPNTWSTSAGTVQYDWSLPWGADPVSG
jgi:alpha-galactosidase